MDPLPIQTDYASWAYTKSGVEDLWVNFDSFFQDYLRAGEILAQMLPRNKEFSTRDRLRLICGMNNKIDEKQKDPVVEALHSNYWKQYYGRCFVHKDVNDCLPKLARQTKLGVVSNFKIKGGIESILEQFNLRQYFDFVLTSIEIGWRKPNSTIYRTALEKTECLPEEIFFVGDDFDNDVKAPLDMGMHAILLDRRGRYKDITSRFKISQFEELEAALQPMV